MYIYNNPQIVFAHDNPYLHKSNRPKKDGYRML